jgi:hypothetical protein
MLDQAEVSARISEMIAATWPDQFSAGLPCDEVPLGAGGLELDSVAIVEALLMCEDTWGVPMVGGLLDGSPLTIGQMALFIVDAR